MHTHIEKNYFWLNPLSLVIYLLWAPEEPPLTSNCFRWWQDILVKYVKNFLQGHCQGPLSENECSCLWTWWFFLFFTAMFFMCFSSCCLVILTVSLLLSSCAHRCALVDLYHIMKKIIKIGIVLFLLILEIFFHVSGISLALSDFFPDTQRHWHIIMF